MGGVNDVTIISGIILFLLGCAVLLPFINGAFNANQNMIADYLQIQTKMGDDLSGINDNTLFGLVFPTFIVNLGKILASIVLMFFWSFQVPIFIELLLFLPLRIILALIIARNVWIGGGG